MLLFIVAVPQQSESVKGEVKLKQEQFQYHPDYKNHSSKRFKELSSSFEKNVSMLLSHSLVSRPQAQHSDTYCIF